MALIVDVATFIAVALFLLVAAALGSRILRLSSVELKSADENLLFSIAVGVISLEVLLFFVQVLGHFRLGATLVIGLSVLIGRADFLHIVVSIRDVWLRIKPSTRFEALLACLTVLIAMVQFLVAMAPLTGSDAMHYHFVSQQLIIDRGFHPDFFLSHSFFCGQGHLLIFLGLLAGSAMFSMGLLFLGGLLTAAALACLASRWMGREWVWIVILLFLCTPVVFWQVSASGSPDIWMAFYATVGVIIVSRVSSFLTWQYALLAGTLAGGIAGAKYTGCIFATSLAAAFLLEARSILRTFAFGAGALLSGVWPYARNAVWSGDPVFPFLMRALHSDRVNTYALTAYLADTSGGAHKGLGEVLTFPLFAAIDPAQMGFWQFFGPIVVAFVPFLFLVVVNDSAWRVALIVWIASALGVGVTSGMSRFLLPVFPIAIACVIGGIAEGRVARWRIVQIVSSFVVVISILSGLAGLLIYGKDALAVSLGFVTREKYLQLSAPDYQAAQFVNETLRDKDRDHRVLVFFRHVYYLGVPYLSGDPTSSWAMDPSALQTRQEWMEFFRANGVNWIVRSPSYPVALASMLDELEKTGDIVPVARRDVENFQGNRIHGVRGLVTVVILRVNLDRP